VLLGILLAALLAEVALRFAGYDSLYFNALNSFHEPHPLVGYRGKPNFEGRFRKPDFDVVIAHDSNGFRRQEHQVPRSLSRYAVLVFGDSFTWGWGVAQGRVLTDVMSLLLSDAHVVNFGLNASGTLQQFTLFATYGSDQLRPDDVVLLMFFSNDFENNVEGRLRAEVRNGQVVLAGPPRQLHSRTSDAIEESSRLINFLFFSANQLKAAWRRSRARHRARELVELGDQTPEVLVTKHYLAAFQRACEERQAHFLVAYVPEQAELGEASHADENRLKNDRAFRRAFLSITESLGIQVIDLLPAFLATKSAGPPGLRLTYPRDSHWNDVGHKVAAEVIARFISTEIDTADRDFGALPQ
jgi:lysophospholipase L1-like esterase